jgi:hypothetical protein
MNLQNKTSLEIVSLATVLIAVIGFIDYLFNLNFTSRLPYPWSLPVQFFRKFNHFVLFLLINGFVHCFYIIYFDSKHFIYPILIPY